MAEGQLNCRPIKPHGLVSIKTQMFKKITGCFKIEAFLVLMNSRLYIFVDSAVTFGL